MKWTAGKHSEKSEMVQLGQKIDDVSQFAEMLRYAVPVIFKHCAWD